MSATWDDAVLSVIDPGSGSAAATSGPPTSPPVVKLPPFVLPTAQPDGSVVYIVQPGDSLWRIAANTGKTIDEIKAMNGLTSNVLTAGQRLIIGEGPTATPEPTIEPTEDVQALTAEAPTPEEVASPTAPPAGTTEICALLYEDVNGNGQQEADEAAIASGQLAILDANTGAPLQAYTTKPEDTNGHCFKDLPPGTYTVAASAPAGYNPTTATSVLRQADAGLHYKLQFGAQHSSSAIGGGGSSKANLRTALFGAAGVVFLLLAAGVAGFLVLRRR
jgi:LysM repeat protein